MKIRAIIILSFLNLVSNLNKIDNYVHKIYLECFKYFLTLFKICLHSSVINRELMFFKNIFLCKPSGLSYFFPYNKSFKVHCTAFCKV